MVPIRLACEAMRVRFEIVLAGAPDPDLIAAGEEALAEIERVEAALNPYDPGSDLFAINTGAARRPVRVLPTTIRFLQRARELSQRTDGAFDPTLTGKWDAVHLVDEDATVAFTEPDLHLDPGAIGKGWALDRATDLLRSLGITSALLHGGTSSAIALGTSPGDAGWRIALGTPDGETLLLADRALSVSSNRYRAHVIDPRTGDTSDTRRLAAATASSAMDAEALSTALLVLGAEGKERLTSRFPDTTLWLFDTP